MVRMMFTFLAIALAAACFGFGVIPGYKWDAGIAVAGIFVVLAVLAFVASRFKASDAHLQRAKILNLPRQSKW